MTSDEKELMQDLINQASNKINSLQECMKEKDAEIKRLKSEFKQLQTNAEILARGVRDFNHENYELTEKVKQAQINVLNKVKEQLFFGVSLSYLRLYIDNLIKEVQNET